MKNVPRRLMARSRLPTDYTVSMYDVMGAIHHLCVELTRMRAAIPGKRFQQTDQNRGLFDINQLIDLYETRHRVTFMRCLQDPNLLVPVFFDAEARSLEECDRECAVIDLLDECPVGELDLGVW